MRIGRIGDIIGKRTGEEGVLGGRRVGRRIRGRQEAEVDIVIVEAIAVNLIVKMMVGGDGRTIEGGAHAGRESVWTG